MAATATAPAVSTTSTALTASSGCKMILSRRCRDYNTQGKKAEGKRGKRREERCGVHARARARAEPRRRVRAGFLAQAQLVVATQYTPRQRLHQGPDVARVRCREARPETSCQDFLQAWKLLPSGRGYVLRQVSNKSHRHTHTHTNRHAQANNHPAQEKEFSLPFTICLCLFSQLLG